MSTKGGFIVGNYTEREVKVSIRRLNAAIEDIISASYVTYKANIEYFVELSRSNPIIESIVEPFRNIDINFEEIHISYNGHWINEVRLPSSMDHRIAYIIKVFDAVSEKQISLVDFTLKIYKHKRLADNIREYLNDIAVPQLKELLYMLNDLLEDEVQGKESIPEAAFHLINHGTIHASQGSNIGLGKDIQQTANYNNNITNEIMEKIRNIEGLSEEKINEIEVLANEVQEEINNSEPSPGKLKKLATKVYEIGETAALKAFTTAVSDPRWGQAAAETLMGMY